MVILFEEYIARLWRTGEKPEREPKVNLDRQMLCPHCNTPQVHQVKPSVGDSSIQDFICKKCGKLFQHVIKDVVIPEDKPEKIIYDKCPHCGKTKERKTPNYVDFTCVYCGRYSGKKEIQKL